jgi:hypothetical protein
MDFRERLQRATERGQRTRADKLREQEARALSEEECRRLHFKYRLELTEYIETCVRQLADNIPGFQLETIVDESGWGTGVSRDDVGVRDGRRTNLFSRLQLVVSPFNSYHVLDLSAKGTIRNKESFARNHFQGLADVDLECFHELIELWVLDYAELFAATT